MVQLCRMQVTTSCRMRRAGTWNSTSLVTTVGTPAARAMVDSSWSRSCVVRPAAQRQRHIGAVAESFAQPAQLQRAGIVGLVRHQDRDQALAICDDIVPVEMAFAPCRRASCRATAGGTAANRPAGRSDRPGRTCRRRDRGGSRRSAGRRSPWRPHGRERCRRGCCGRRSPAPRCRASAACANSSSQETGAAQEREMRSALAARHSARAHPKIPCRNQRCEPVAASSPSPARKIQKRSPASSSTWK